MLHPWTTWRESGMVDLLKGGVLAGLVILTYPQVWSSAGAFADTVYPIPWPGILLLLALCGLWVHIDSAALDLDRIRRAGPVLLAFVAGLCLVFLRLLGIVGVRCLCRGPVFPDSAAYRHGLLCTGCGAGCAACHWCRRDLGRHVWESEFLCELSGCGRHSRGFRHWNGMSEPTRYL